MKNNKTILLIAPKFFNYENSIIQELQSLKFNVIFIEDRPYKNFFLRAIVSYFPNLLSFHYNYVTLNKIKKYKADYLFVINGQTLSPKSIEYFKLNNINSVTILYLWDSIKNRKNSKLISPLFDKVFSFDKDDCLKFNFIFKNLFFISDYREKISKNSYLYDICIFGTVHGDRPLIVDYIINKYPDLKIYTHLYIQSIWVYFIKKYLLKCLGNLTYKNFSFEKISSQDIMKVFSLSRVVLDINHPSQTGLTMRTFEAIASNKKIITTNHNINNLDLFCYNNFSVISRSNFELDLDFIKSPHNSIPDLEIEKYSLRNWLSSILNL